ncbi:hypothetical protein DC025_14220, partial [Enterococcus faecalis]
AGRRAARVPGPQAAEARGPAELEEHPVGLGHHPLRGRARVLVRAPVEVRVEVPQHGRHGHVRHEGLERAPVLRVHGQAAQHVRQRRAPGEEGLAVPRRLALEEALVLPAEAVQHARDGVRRAGVEVKVARVVEARGRVPEGEQAPVAAAAV